MALKLNGTNSVAAPAYAGDDADTGLQCGTNELKLVTGGTARATVDSSGNVGIGTTSPTGFSGYTVLDINNATNGAIIDLSQGDAMKGRLVATSSSMTTETSSGVPIIFSPAGTEEARFLVGGGLTFNGDTAAANALSDYEEGTFSPFSATQISDHSITIPAEAHYVKIGRLVQIWMRVQYTGTSSAAISGNMPFPCSNPTNSASKSPFFLSVFPKSGSPTNMCFAYLGANSTTGFTIYQNNNNYPTLNFNSTPDEITITGCYRST